MTSPIRPTRRRFLQIIGVGLAAPKILAACGDDGGGGTKDGALYFPESVASGDPRPDSVILWARVADAKAGAEAEVELVVATDEALSEPLVERTITVLAEYDHIAKVKVTGLSAATTYYYQFTYVRGGTRYTSRVGRTKTAADPTSDVPVTLAVASCQDFIGRYYHSYAKMLDVIDSIDVVVHLGDYIYETTGDAFFQSSPTENRRVELSDTAGAIAFEDGEGATTHYAAQSLSNYRELYRTYRSDPWLQKVHEKVPFIFIWDDHEFSDDSWGDSATYFDGRVNEDGEATRKAAAERANFEYLPTESGLDGDGFADLASEVPSKDASVFIYRDYRFGKHVHLVLTDTRSYRPDHLIPEDVYPGRIALSQTALQSVGLDPQRVDGDPPAPFYPTYVDLETYAGGSYKAPLVAALTTFYAAQLPDADASEHTRHATEQATGLWSAAAINTRLKAAIDAGDLDAIDVADVQLSRGATFDKLRFSAGKFFAADGVYARYLVERQHYQAYARVRYAQDAASQDVFGAAQESWLIRTLTESDATWRVLTSSISFSEMTVDARLASFPPALEGLPDTDTIKAGVAVFSALLTTPYLLSVDQWDGFPQKRDEVLAMLRLKPNGMILSGDIHSFYATNHGQGAGNGGVVELTTGGISSESFKGFVRGIVKGLVGAVAEQPSVQAAIAHLEELLQYNFPQMTYANNDAAGFATLTIGATEADATFYMAPVDTVLEDLSEADAKAAFTATGFKIKSGVLTVVE